VVGLFLVPPLLINENIRMILDNSEALCKVHEDLGKFGAAEDVIDVTAHNIIRFLFE
jgi:hypothetical protein